MRGATRSSSEVSSVMGYGGASAGEGAVRAWSCLVSTLEVWLRLVVG
jgi:hypothetical protein